MAFRMQTAAPLAFAWPSEWELVKSRYYGFDVHVHHLHATVLHLTDIDHERLTYRYGGRDFRLPSVAGRIVYDIIA